MIVAENDLAPGELPGIPSGSTPLWPQPGSSISTPLSARVLEGEQWRAADREASGMAALIGVDLDQALEVTRARQELGGRLEVANVNAPGQVVLAGGSDDIEWLARAFPGSGSGGGAPQRGGAFHSQFMIPAQEELTAALETIEIPSHGSRSGQIQPPDRMRAMRSVIFSPVRWSSQSCSPTPCWTCRPPGSTPSCTSARGM